MKLFTKIAATVVVTFGSLMGVTAGHTQSLPIKVGMNYGEARSRLVQQGWQPHVPTGASLLSCGSKGTCIYDGLDKSAKAKTSFFQSEINFRKVFREQGWYETVHCYPTGAGWCFHSFTDAYGKELVVRTGSGMYDEMPSVDKFYFAQ